MLEIMRHGHVQLSLVPHSAARAHGPLAPHNLHYIKCPRAIALRSIALKGVAFATLVICGLRPQSPPPSPARPTPPGG